MTVKDRVDFICPYCDMTCGWNAKKRDYDSVEVLSEHDNTIQYAHARCVEGAGQRPLSRPVAERTLDA